MFLAYDASASAVAGSPYALLSKADLSTIGPSSGMYVAEPQPLHERSLRRVAVTVSDIPDMRVTLLQPVSALIVQGPTNVTVTSRILDVYGIGDDVREAMADWYREVADEFSYLSQHKD